jgi:hypothetical protein
VPNYRVYVGLGWFTTMLILIMAPLHGTTVSLMATIASLDLIQLNKGVSLCYAVVSGQT